MKKFDQLLRKEVTVLGANGFFSKVTSLLLKQSPSVNVLNLFDYENIESGDDLNLIKSKCRVRSYSGKDRIAEAIKSADVVLISDNAAPGSSFYNPYTDFLHKAKKITEYAAHIAACNSSSIIVVATSPINFCLPLANEILTRLGKLDTSKVIGMTNVDVIRANSLFASHLHVNPRSVWLPVIGGSSQETRVPIFSKAKPALTFNLRMIQKLTSEIKTFDIQVHGIKRESELLNRAHATARLINAVLAGLEGKEKIVETVMSQQEIVKDVRFMSLPVQLGKEGIQRRIPLPRVSEYESRLLAHAIKCLASDANKAIDYVNSNVDIEELKLNSRVRKLNELEASQGNIKEIKKSVNISNTEDKIPLKRKIKPMSIGTEKNPESVITLSDDIAKDSSHAPQLDFIDETIPIKYLTNKREVYVLSSKNDRKIKISNKSSSNAVPSPITPQEMQEGQIPPDQSKPKESRPLFIYHSKEDSKLNNAIMHFDKNRIESEDITSGWSLEESPIDSSIDILKHKSNEVATSVIENAHSTRNEEETINLPTSHHLILEKGELSSKKDNESTEDKNNENSNDKYFEDSDNNGTDISNPNTNLNPSNSTVTRNDYTNFDTSEAKFDGQVFSSLQKNSVDTEEKENSVESKAVDYQSTKKRSDTKIQNGNQLKCQCSPLEGAEDAKNCDTVISLNSEPFNLYSPGQSILRGDLLKKVEEKFTCFNVLGSSRYMSSTPLTNEEEDLSSNVDKKKYKPRAEEILNFFKEKRDLAIKNQSKAQEEGGPSTLLKRKKEFKFKISPQIQFGINDESCLTKRLVEKQRKLITSVKNNDVLFDMEKAEKPVSNNVTPYKITKFHSISSHSTAKSNKMTLNNDPTSNQVSPKLKNTYINNLMKQRKKESMKNSDKFKSLNSMESEALKFVPKSCQLEENSPPKSINDQNNPVIHPDSSLSKNDQNEVPGIIGVKQIENSLNYEIGNPNKEGSSTLNIKHEINHNLPAIMPNVNNDTKSGKSTSKDNQKENTSTSEKALVIVSVCPDSCSSSQVKC